VREVFAELIRANIPPERIVQLIREGLDAMDIKCFVHKDGVIYSRPLVNFTERRHYIELAVRFGGYYVDRNEIELADQDDDLPVEQLIKNTEALLAALKGEA